MSRVRLPQGKCSKLSSSASSEHALDELVDLLLTVAPDTALLEWVALLLESLGWGVELEWPEEVVGLLEVVTAGPDLVDEVLNAGNTLLSEGLLNDAVVVKSDTGSVDLTVASLVDQSADVVTGWVSVGDEWLDKSDHVDGGSVELDEHSVVELSQTEELHDLLLLWSELVDTK